MTIASPTEPTPTPTPVASRPRGRPRKTAEERDDGNRRQALLATAAHLFRLQGFDATSTRDIATAAGMRSGSPFYHFENKQALLAAVMREGMRSALERQTLVTAALPAQATPRERLSALVRNHFEVLLGPNSDFIPVMLYEWRRLAPEQVGEITGLKDAYEAAWVPVLTALHSSGQLAGDPVLARFMIFGALNWSVQWYRPPPPRVGRAQRRATLDDLTTTALQLFLKDRP
ncbi:MAG: AcrR family transcriptional regulator [Hydrogenophaga sp.]|jgi:AcrR family transcriptional regulator